MVKINDKSLSISLTNINDFKEIISKYLIEYANNNHAENYGLVYNILCKEMDDLIMNINKITENKLCIEQNLLYINIGSNVHIDSEKHNYPEPVVEIFLKTLNYFKQIHNI